MSTEVAVPELTVQQRVVAAFAKCKTEKELTELAAKHVDIKAITNEAGRDQVHAARMVLKNTRVEVQKFCEDVREAAVQFGRGVIVEQKRLIGLIQPEETRLETLQQEWDDAREAEKEARIQAEMKRVADLQDRVAELRGCPNLTPSSGSALIADHIGDLEALPVDETLQEFQQAGADAKTAGLARLRALHDAALAHEAEQARLKEEREDLARLRAAQKKIDDDAKAARDAETARQNAELKKAREAQEAENARVRAEQAAEAKRLADAAADLARQQEALRKAQEPPPAAPPLPPAPVSRRGVAVPVPKANEIIDALAKHYRARPDTIIEWLRAIDWKQAEAA